MPNKKLSNNDIIKEINDKQKRLEQQKIEEIERMDDMEYGVDKSGVGGGVEREDSLREERTREYENQDKVREEMDKRRGDPQK